MPPLVSIIIPTHNRAHLVSEAVNSVLQQTYTHVEIIVVDDGSTDETWETLVEYGTQIHAIKQIKSGVSAARNRGITEARGEFIAFLDSDDYFMLHKLETQVAFMMAHPDAVMSYTGYIECDVELNPVRLVSPLAYPRGWRDLLRGCTIATPTVMVRRSILNQVGLFDELLNLSEDLDLWCRIAQKGPILPIEQTLSKVRIHSRGIPRDPQEIIQIWLSLVTKFYQGHSTFRDWIEKRRTCSYLYGYVVDIALSQNHPPKNVLWYATNAIWQDPFHGPGVYLLKKIFEHICSNYFNSGLIL